MIFVIVVVVLVTLAGFFGWIRLSSFRPDQIQTETVTCKEEAPILSSTEEIKLLSWNIQYLAGKNYYFYYESGNDRQPSSEDVARTTKEVVRVVKDEDPDVILFQELDEGLKRTDREDQLESLLELLPDEYACHVSAFYWKTFFPLRFARNDFAGIKLSIVSKYEITEALRHQLSLRRRNWVARQTGLKRAVLEARLPRTHGPDFLIFNTHLSAFASGAEARTRQIEEIQYLLQRRTAEGYSWILGGDFNLLPPEKGVDEKRDIKLLFEDYQAVPSFEELNGPNQAEWYTHFPNDPQIDKPDRILDYFFLSDQVSLGEHYVRREDTLEISDHLPLITKIQLSGEGWGN
ncbi:MAG: endonuclease/exonuclease/phosphatase family protein [Candidatus Acetothermia bacterium]